MMLYIRSAIITFLIFSSLHTKGQAVYEEERYVPETNALVNAKLEQWQDLKFGLLMHWGAYSQWGIVESWSLCPEEYGWCERKKGSDPSNYVTYKQEYEDLQKTFNPTKFDPDKWAKAAKNAGMKYVVFTTKHHDGFCMFDSKYTDYKVTDSKTPFSSHPKSNIAKEIFNSFRKEGMWAGAYFSKPDWHSPYYWDPYYPPRDRNVNYEPEANPEKWNKYIDFTHNQIMELVTDYGPIDILWLDGGWVAKTPKSEITTWYDKKLAEAKDGYLKHRIINQDIRMDELVAKARKVKPDLIVVDRAVHGINQNYLTPENRVPEMPLPYPWESCIIAGGGWSYSFNAKYMSSREAIHTLVDIVAKGGNLLLNIAPSPTGEWDQGAYDLLEDIGAWLDHNGDAIYSTNSIAPYKFQNVCVTESKDGSVNLIYLLEEGENMPKEFYFSGLDLASFSKATLLGIEDKNIKWRKVNNGYLIDLSNMNNKVSDDVAFTIKFEK